LNPDAGAALSAMGKAALITMIVCVGILLAIAAGFLMMEADRDRIARRASDLGIAGARSRSTVLIWPEQPIALKRAGHDTHVAAR